MSLGGTCLHQRSSRGCDRTGSSRNPLVLAQRGKEEGWGGVALFAGLGPLGSPTSSWAAVKAAGLTSTFLGLRPSSPVRGDMVQRVGPTCFEGRGRARPFLSQDAGPGGGVYRRVG